MDVFEIAHQRLSMVWIRFIDAGEGNLFNPLVLAAQLGYLQKPK